MISKVKLKTSRKDEKENMFRDMQIRGLYNRFTFIRECYVLF